MECVVITGTSAADLQTNINAWLVAPEFEMTIKFVSLSEGTVGAAVLKAIIFYEKATHAIRS